MTAANRVDLHTQKDVCTYRSVYRKNGKLHSMVDYIYTSTPRYSIRAPITVVKRQESGFRPPSSYFATWETEESLSSKGAIEVGSSTYIRTFSGSGFEAINNSYFTVPPMRKWDLDEVPSNLVGKAVNGCLQKFEDQNANYLLMAAEGSRSIGLIASTCRTFAQALHLARQGRMHAAATKLGVSWKGKKSTALAKNSHELASRWLELQYGWKPLLTDLMGVLQDVEDKFRKEYPVSARYAPRREKEDIIPEFGGYHARGGGKKSYWLGEIRSRLLHVCKVRLDATLSIPALRASAKFGFSDVAAVAWELVPYSFLWDWVNPVGDFLACFDSTLGLSFRGGSITYLSTVEQKRKFTIGEWGFTHGSGGSVSGSFRAGQMRREVLSDFPNPRLYLKNPWSTGHAWNAIALLRVTIRNGKKFRKFEDDKSSQSKKLRRRYR